MRPRVGPEGLQVTTQSARLLEGNSSAVPMPSGKPELMASVGHKTMIAYRNSEAAHVLRKPWEVWRAFQHCAIHTHQH